MSTITLPRATVQQALQALRAMNPYPASKEDQRASAPASLRAALVHQAEPVGKTCTYKCEAWPECGCAPPKAEPVQEPAFHGFMSDDGTQVDVCFSPSAPRRDGTYATAYYTAPPHRVAQQAAPVQEPAYKVKVTGRWHDTEPLAAAFSLPDGEHLLYTAPRKAEPVLQALRNLVSLCQRMDLEHQAERPSEAEYQATMQAAQAAIQAVEGAA